MTVATIKLPWPPSALSPNGSHGHWAPHAKAKKQYRDSCYLHVLEQRVRKPAGDRFDVLLVFVPPAKQWHPKQQPDRDNCMARAKALLDGLALAWGIDDSSFVRTASELGPIDSAHPHGCVVVTVTARGAQGAAP